MKKNIWLSLILIVQPVLIFAADPLEGYWLSVDHETKKVTAAWCVYEDGGSLTGVLVAGPYVTGDTLASRCTRQYPSYPIAGKLSEMKLLNLPLLYGLQKKSSGMWAGGKIIDPENGKFYTCDLIFHPADGKKYKEDNLELKVFIVSQFWRRATKAEAEAAF